MHIECITEKLVKALAKAEKITSKNITLPVLGCVFLSAHDNELIIRSTNLDLGIEITIPVKVFTPGTVAVSGAIVYNFITNIHDKNITLSVDGTTLCIKTKQSESHIKTFASEDFPTIPKTENGVEFQVSSLDIQKGFKAVSYSASVSTIRPALSSVYMYPEDNHIVFVSTDSFRLAEKRIRVKKHIECSPVIIPLKNIADITRSFDDVKDDITVSVGQNQISFFCEGVYVTSRLIDGTFPDYKQIIPKEVKTEVTLLKQDFVTAMRISNIFSDKFSQVIFSITPTKKDFTITTKNIDVGENMNSLDSVIKGNDLTISFNYKYIIDCFQSLENDSITLQFVDNSKALVIRSVGDSSFLYLVMPMNK